MAEMGLIKDPRCADALDLLERKKLPRGGWAAQGRFYKVSGEHGYELEVRIDFSSGLGRERKRSHERVVTADALYVLRAAGRVCEGLPLPA